MVAKVCSWSQGQPVSGSRSRAMMAKSRSRGESVSGGGGVVIAAILAGLCTDRSGGNLPQVVARRRRAGQRSRLKLQGETTMDLTNASVLVTGGAGGFGGATARRLA